MICFGHLKAAEQVENTTLLCSIISLCSHDMLANGWIFPSLTDMEQHQHSFGDVFLATY